MASSHKRLLVTRMHPYALAAILITLICSCATTNREASAAVQTSVIDSINCEQFADRSSSLNAPELFNGADNCSKPFLSTLLLHLGQIRFETDLSLLKPPPKFQKQNEKDLIAEFFLIRVGLGPVEQYRDDKNWSALRAEIVNWTPEYSENYNPGWIVADHPDASVYAASISHFKNQNIHRADEWASLLRDDEYYAMLRELRALESQVRHNFSDNPQEMNRALELREKMARREEELTR